MENKNKIVHAIYDDDDVLLKAVKELRLKKYVIEEVFTPFPVHGLDKVMGLSETRIAITSFIYGCIGLTVAILMMNYMMIEDWPQNIGGKPSFSYVENMPAFVPIMFELTVYFAAHLMVITFYLRSRLWPFKKAENPIPETTDDKFLIQIPIYGNESKIKSILKKTDLFKMSVIDAKKENNEEIDNVQSNVQDRDTEITIGFVFHSRKYSDGSSNLRIQFTKGRGQQYAKNSGLRIFRKHWISKKNEVSDKHVDYIKINKSLNALKANIEKAKNKFSNGSIDFEDVYKSIIN